MTSFRAKGLGSIPGMKGTNSSLAVETQEWKVCVYIYICVCLCVCVSVCVCVCVCVVMCHCFGKRSEFCFLKNHMMAGFTVPLKYTHTNDSRTNDRNSLTILPHRRTHTIRGPTAAGPQVPPHKTRPSVTSCPHNTHFLYFPSSPPGATLIVSVATDGIS